MVFTVAKIDWDAIYKEYLRALECEPELSTAEFARRGELNINSARRSFNKIKSERLGGTDGLKGTKSKGDRSPSKADQVASKKDRSPKKDDSKKSTRKPLKSKTKPAAKTGKADTPAQPQHSETDFEKVFDQISAPSRRKVVGDKSRDQGFRGVKHGAYMDIAKLDPELIDAAILLNQDDGIPVLMSARYLQLRRNQSEMLEAIEIAYSKGEGWKDDLGNSIPRSKAEGQALYGTSKPLTELEAQMEKIKAANKRFELDEQKLALLLDEAHPLSRVQRIKRTKIILQYRIDNDLTAVETSYIFENDGVEIPRTLAAEADKEISLRQPTREETPETTAEELDQMMLEYEAQREHWDGDWLADRMQGISELKAMSATDEVEIIE